MADETLAPVLLVSMPQMLDPNFSKTVVLLAEYGAHGAFGLVLNRRMDEAIAQESGYRGNKPLSEASGSAQSAAQKSEQGPLPTSASAAP